MLTQAQYQAATDELAASIEPTLVAAVDAQKAQILSGVNVFWRFIAARMWSAFLALVPILARVALAAILDRFSSKTIGEVADLLYAHQKRLAAQTDKEPTP